MAKTEDYEILPHKLLEDLKFDVEALKKKLAEPDTKSNELILEIETLKDSVHELNTIFKEALEETKEEDIYKSIQLLNERIDAVVTQNETIAKGMIAISDKVDDFMSRFKGPMPSAKPVAQNAPPPTIGAMPSRAPPMGPPGMPPPPGEMPSPPSPNGNGKKRKGLFK